MFGTRTGILSKRERTRREKAARRHGATFNVIHGNSGHCVCGHGCRLNACPILTTWFSSPNRGEPFDRELAAKVLAELGEQQ